MTFNFKRDCRNILRHIKTPKQRGGCMPYATGHLADESTHGRFLSDNEFVIEIDISEEIGAPYAPALNDGSVPHNIPHAFGRPAPFGLSGRFDGKFHPGSKKHIGFWDNADDSNSVLGYALNYFVRHYEAKIGDEQKTNH